MGIDCVASETKSAGSQRKVKKSETEGAKAVSIDQLLWLVGEYPSKLFSIETWNFYALF